LILFFLNFCSLSITLFLIFLQDYKDRLVYGFLYFFVFLFTFLNQLFYADYRVIIGESILNLMIISFVLFFSFLISKFVLKKDFVNGSIGIGDIFLFFALCFSFPVVSFIIFFVSSLFFSLFLHFFISKQKDLIPLAGYMSLFFLIVYFIIFITNYNIYKFNIL